MSGQILSSHVMQTVIRDPLEAAAATERGEIERLMVQARTAWLAARERDATKTAALDADWQKLLFQWQHMNSVCSNGAPNAQPSVTARATIRSTAEAAIVDFEAVKLADIGRPRHVNPLLLAKRLMCDFSPERMRLEAEDAAAPLDLVVPLPPEHPAERIKTQNFRPSGPDARFPNPSQNPRQHRAR